MADGLDPGFTRPFYTPSDRHLHPELGIDSWEEMPLFAKVRDSPCRQITRVIVLGCWSVSLEILLVSRHSACLAQIRDLGKLRSTADAGMLLATIGRLFKLKKGELGRISLRDRLNKREASGR